MDIPVIYENGSIAVINKPAGIVVNRSESTREGTIQDWAEHKFSKNPASPARFAEPASPRGESRRAGRNLQFSDDDSEFKARSGIVHRLDKDTSGILLIAKSPGAFTALKRQFMERTVEKTYRAIVHGTLPNDGEIRVPVARLPWNRMRFGVVPGGRASVTKFRALGTTDMGEGIGTVTLAELYPETGRTHQIRVHMQYIGHPVVGDALYGGRKVYQRDIRAVTRLMLHAYRIVFHHPTSGERLVFEAAIPDDMKRIIDA